MDRCICIHCHFYQPPRENPWLEEVELQESAYPYHDWNERINAECYAPNSASRIVGSESRIVEVSNNYAKISFNFGPTLLSWLETHASSVYNSILEADKKSAERFSGHGSALAQIYNHMIMPLANRRDKVTQTRWAINDFEKRFQRYPEGMWLPETSVDMETLEVLAEQNVKFTILAPHQAAKVRKIGEDNFVDVTGGKINTRRTYLCHLPSSKTLAIFFYDKLISHEVAFGSLLSNGEVFAKRLLQAFREKKTPQLVHIATDGETFGHHKSFGDMALAYALHRIDSDNSATITNYGEFLEKFPPRHEVQIVENTSWSCIHGIERWRNNCGCRIGTRKSWNQQWRQPLRTAMDWLRDRLALIFESEVSKHLADPWEARNDYISIILDRSRENIEQFLVQHAKKDLSHEEKRATLKLLEMQRQSLLMYSSCGWFFDEISRIETVQVMKYAARAIQIAKDFGNHLEEDYIRLLTKASSNIVRFENGGNVFQTLVKPANVDLLNVGTHYAISSILERGNLS